MAAQQLCDAGFAVDLFDAMPSVGRKFLLAGIGGLNISHSEDLDAFTRRYREQGPTVAGWLADFGPAAVRDWCAGLGVETFVGSSGRVFPRDMKAAPLLRAWLHRLRGAGVRFHMRHRWQGFVETTAGRALRFAGPDGPVDWQAPAVVLALGGASWQRLGSDGAWVPWLQQHGVPVAPLRPANCGFDVARPTPEGTHQPGWTPHFLDRFAGAPLRTIAVSCIDVDGQAWSQRGEAVVTRHGVEGSVVYAASAVLRALIERHGQARLSIDLLPQHRLEQVHAEVARPRGARSLSTHLKSRLHIDGVKAGLLRELLPRETLEHPDRLANALKALPLTLVAPRPIDEAISTAGGVRLDALDDHLMCGPLDGVYCAGEMLDWEAPTGGYLLTACLASGVRAGQGAAARLRGLGGAPAAASVMPSPPSKMPA